MKPQVEPSSSPSITQLSADFSLVLGGPLFQFLRRAHLSDDALLLVRQRLIAFVALTWVPLLLLSALAGQAWSTDGVVPFLHDVEAHVRFLVAMPLLIMAEKVIHLRMRPLIQQFEKRQLIPPAAIPDFNRAIEKALQLRNSITAEVILLAVVYLLGVTVIWRQYLALDASTWYASIAAGGGTELTIAGWWYGYISLPIFQFLLLRWYFRLFIWALFLWRVAKIQLALVPTHPDRLGGIGFLSQQVYALTMLGTAHGALLAGTLANQIFFAGATLIQFKVEIALVALYILFIFLGPLLIFMPQLSAARRTGLGEYGILAQRYARDFDDKWIRGNNGGDELLGSGDIQSLADLGNSFAVVKEMRVVPIQRDDVLRLLVATLLPLVPLGLTMMSFEELIKTLVKVAF